MLGFSPQNIVAELYAAFFAYGDGFEVLEQGRACGGFFRGAFPGVGAEGGCVGNASAALLRGGEIQEEIWKPLQTVRI